MDKWIVDDLVFVKDPAGYYVPEAELIVEGLMQISNKFNKTGSYILVQAKGAGYKVIAVCPFGDHTISDKLVRMSKDAKYGLWVASPRPMFGGVYLDDN